MQIKNPLKTYTDTLFHYFLLTLIVGILPALVTEDYFGKDYIHVVMIIGFGFIIYLNAKGVLFEEREEKLIKFGFAIFLIALLGYFQQDPVYTRFAPGLDNFSKGFIPLVLLSFLFFIKKPKTETLLFTGIALGTLVATVLTLIGYAKNLPRGGGTVHGAPIIFGDLAMLYGLLAIVIAFYFFSLKKYIYASVFVVLCLLGIFSSISSGTKGGLLALFTLPFLFFPLISEKKHKYYFLITILAILILITILIFTTNNLLKPRLFELWKEFMMVLEGDLSGPTLGYRLQMWKYSWDLFLQHPIFGIGIGEFYSIKMHLIQQGLINPGIERFKHSHSEYFSILSNEGIVGALLYIWFFKWLFSLFYSALKSSLTQLKYLGLLGLTTLTCYLDFSLSESFLSSHLGGTAFFTIMTLLIHSINRGQSSQPENSLSK